MITRKKNIKNNVKKYFLYDKQPKVIKLFPFLSRIIPYIYTKSRKAPESKAHIHGRRNIHSLKIL